MARVVFITHLYRQAMADDIGALADLYREALRLERLRQVLGREYRSLLAEARSLARCVRAGQPPPEGLVDGLLRIRSHPPDSGI